MSVPTYRPYNRIVHETYVDFVGRYVSKPVHVVQGDHELPIVAVKLFVNGVQTSIADILSSGSSEVNVRCRDKKSNTVYMSALGVSPSADTIYFEITDEMTQTPGDVELVIEIKVNGQIAQSSRVMLDVDRNPIKKTEDPPDIAGSVLILNYKRPQFEIMNSEFVEVDYVLEEAG